MAQDEFFNNSYAAHVYDVISKLDDDTAEIFSTMVVHDSLHRHIDDNRRHIDSRTEEILKSIQSDVAKSLRQRPGDPNAIATAALVQAVSKNQWDENKVNRHGKGSSTGGQFAPKGGAKTDSFTPAGKTKYRATVKQGKDGKKNVKIVSRQKGVPAGGGDPITMERDRFDVTQALGTTNREGSRFAQEWTAPDDPRNNDRTYARVAAGSRLMSEAGRAGAAAGVPGAGAAALAGDVGQFAGSFGPEAERVIGPSMRKTAYRYRGTERPVDTELNSIRRQELGNHRRQSGISPEAMDGDFKTEVSRAAAVQYLSSKLPSKQLGGLQRESGKLPPSEGVIINADGSVITQAVGYQEDHYLPFNLKNLKGMKGGSYVRTRSSGGLTSEDIYTGLMSGARSVTVVSRSGVFTLDFEDDFRGQRRYSDKARQMVDRYEKTLDAIQSETVSSRGLDPAERAQIRDEVESEFSYLADSNDGRKQIEQTIKAREKEFRASTHLTSAEIKAIDEQAREVANTRNFQTMEMRGMKRLPDNEEERYKVVRSELIGNAMDAKSKNTHRLDGEGYATALNALREQYPYFIKEPRVQTNREGLQLSNETDTGYVSPGANRPNAVREGYFGVAGPGNERTGQKFSAAEMHHQRPKDREANRFASESARQKDTPEAEAVKPAQEQKAPEKPKSMKQRFAEADRQVQADQQLVAASTAALNAMPEDMTSQYTTLSQLDRLRKQDNPDELNLFVARNRTTIHEEVKRFRDSLDPSAGQNKQIVDSLTNPLSQYEYSQRYADAGGLNRETYSSSPSQPFPVEGIEAGRQPEWYKAEFQNRTSGVPGLKGGIDQLDDDDLRSQARGALLISNAMDAVGKGEEVDVSSLITGLSAVNADIDASAQALDQIERASRDPEARSMMTMGAEAFRNRAIQLEEGRAILQEYHRAKAENSTAGAITPGDSPTQERRRDSSNAVVQMETLQNWADKNFDKTDAGTLRRMTSLIQGVEEQGHDFQESHRHFTTFRNNLSETASIALDRALGDDSPWNEPVSDDDEYNWEN